MQLIKMDCTKLLFICVNKPLVNVNGTHGDEAARHNSYLVDKLAACVTFSVVPYILKSNPHPFCSFRGLKNQMQIRIVCGLDSWSRAGFWKNDRATVHAVKQYDKLLFYLLFII
jgi:hypothetical protein